MRLYAYKVPERSNWIGWTAVDEYVNNVRRKTGGFFGGFLNQNDSLITRFYQEAVKFLNEKTDFSSGVFMLSAGIGKCSTDKDEPALVMAANQRPGLKDFIVTNYEVKDWEHYKVEEYKVPDPKPPKSPIPPPLPTPEERAKMAYEESLKAAEEDGEEETEEESDDEDSEEDSEEEDDE